MKSASRPHDTAASAIRFGVEIETMIPVTAGVAVGGYHNGRAVTTGLDAVTGETVNAPVLDAAIAVDRPTWRADRDGSIRVEPGFEPCEFVSPILHGEEGLANLRAMLAFIRRIGGKVNPSCGLHVTVGIQSVIGTSDVVKVAEFVRTLCHFAHQNAWAIYAQTGTGRHLNTYSHQLPAEAEELLRLMRMPHVTPVEAAQYAERCGRGMVNLRKAFLPGRGAVEFRAFAGTLNEAKILHHLATALGLMRRAAVARTVGRFTKSAKKNRSRSAPEAVRRLWRILGWCDATECQSVALGLFGPLHDEFGRYRLTALRMAEEFEAKFPGANL